MRKALAFNLMVDPKDVRRAVALITGEALTDEELDEKFFNREPVQVAAPEDREFEMALLFVALMTAEEVENEPKRGKFAQKMAEMQKMAKKHNI